MFGFFRKKNDNVAKEQNLRAFPERELVDAARKRNDNNQAALLLGQRLSEYPDEIPLWKELAIVRSKLGDLEGVVESLQKVIAIEPLGPHSKELYDESIGELIEIVRFDASELRRLGKVNDARLQLENFVSRFGARDEVLSDLGPILFQLVRNQDVVECYNKIQAIRPLGPEANLLLARTYLRLGNNVEAEKLLSQQAKLKSPKPAVFFHLAQAHHRLGRREECRKVLEDLAKLQTKDPRKWSLLANGYTDIGDFDRALEVFEGIAAAGYMNAAQKVSHARAALRASKFDRAEELLRHEIPGEKEPFSRHFYLYEARKKAGHTERAIETVKSMYSLKPRSQQDWYKFARMQREIGDSLQAIDSFQKAGDLGLDPKLLKLELAECDLKSGVLSRAAENLYNLVQDDQHNARARFVLARVLVRQGKFDEAQEQFEAVIKLRPIQASAYRELAMIFSHSSQQDEAERLLRIALEIEPNSAPINTELAAICLEKGTYSEARELAEHALKFAPDLANAKMILANLEVFDGGTSAPLSIAVFSKSKNSREISEWNEIAEDARIFGLDSNLDLVAVIEGIESDWIVLDDLVELGNRTTIASRLQGATGAVLLKTEGRDEDVVAFSTSLAKSLVRDSAGSCLQAKELMAALLKSGREVLPRIGQETVEVVGPLESFEGEVFLISSSGHNLFGGAEHFLRTMAQLYTKLGFKPVLVGHRGDTSQKGTTPDGIPFVQIANDDELEFRQLVLERGPTMMHVVTGSGPFVLRCCMDLNVPIVYGTHFWREMLRGSGWYPDVDLTAAPKKEFLPLLLRNQAVYANSKYTRDLQYEHHKLTSEVMYSLPSTVTQAAVRQGREFVLLVNSRPEKGFDLLLDVAEICKEISFVAIASQSTSEDAIIEIDRRGLKNVQIIGQVSDMEELYKKAWCVMVPSYRFVETFSRVVIEAQRYGVPVIGSDRGNVPLLLEESGVALPEDANLWAEELHRLNSEPLYWEKRSSLANENSERYAFELQHVVHERLVRQAKRPVLVAVGNGIGNIIQCTPAIRRLSEHLGQPVDVVINQDFPGCEWLFTGSPYIGMVFGSDSPLMRRDYDHVFVLASFGKAVPQFHAKHTFVARHKIPFEATQTMHEAKYNLECLAASGIGLTFEESDVAEYFVRDLRPNGMNSRRIVLHAGGKPGEWEVKRWPYFEQLASELQKLGWEVISTGMKHEYVPGTVDRTGTTLVETLETIRDAYYVIANDSGLMHVADGIGVPVTALFGPTSVVKNGPLSPNSQVIAPDKSCAPCQFTDRFQTCKCIQDLSLTEVLSKIKIHLQSIGENRHEASPEPA